MRSFTVVAVAVLAVFAVGEWAIAQETPVAQQPATAGPGAVAIPVIYVEAMRIQLDGKTQYAGNVKMEFKPQGQDAKLLSVDVIPKMKSDEIARDLYKQLTLAAGSNFKVKQSGDRITIEKASKKAPTFSLRITNQSVLGVSFLIDKD